MASGRTSTSLRQDGSRVTDAPATTFAPAKHVDGYYEFWPQDYVVGKATGDEAPPVGVIESVNHDQRICSVTWRGSQRREIVPVYEIAPHPDFSFKVGDVVLRLPGPETTPPPDEAAAEGDAQPPAAAAAEAGEGAEREGSQAMEEDDAEDDAAPSGSGGGSGLSRDQNVQRGAKRAAFLHAALTPPSHRPRAAFTPP